MPGLSSTPEYLICLECEMPCYEFEWAEGKLVEVLCNTCGNDDPEQFLTEEEFEQLSGGEADPKRRR